MPDVTRSSLRTTPARPRCRATFRWKGGFLTRPATRSSLAATWSRWCRRFRCRWRIWRFRKACPFGWTAWSLANRSRKWVFCEIGRGHRVVASRVVKSLVTSACSFLSENEDFVSFWIIFSRKNLNKYDVCKVFADIGIFEDFMKWLSKRTYILGCLGSF